MDIEQLIKWDSSGDVFYRQHRLGKNGQRFNLLKFRTMHQNAAVTGPASLTDTWNHTQSPPK